MNDREFIELLNLYVDKEISPEDALRLEAEVAAGPERRKVYDQYCRIQRACCELAEQMAESAADRPASFGAELRAPLPWRMAPFMVGLAAAACIAAFVGLRDRGATAAKGSAGVAVEPAAARPVQVAAEPASAPEPMTAVFSTRPAAGQPERAGARALFAMDEPSSQMPQLSWIEDIHMAPVLGAADSQFLFSQKPDLKATISNGAQNGHDSQQPSEMTAFRFQR